MEITVGKIVAWLVAGALAGSFVGMVVKRRREGFGRYTNLGIGLLGALIGGALFDLFNVSLGLEAIGVSLEDIVTALIGSLILLLILWLWQRQRSRA